jgi:hypothetical protein
MYQNIPGVIAVEGREFRYIESDDERSFAALFWTISSYSDPAPSSGGLLDEGTAIELPSGTTLFGISYKGDVNAWRAAIERCAGTLGLKLGHIAGRSIRLNDDTQYQLRDCRVVTDW